MPIRGRTLRARVFRNLHTIKGSGAMFGFAEIARFTHDVETAFDRVRSGDLPLTRDLVDLTLQAKDHLQALLRADPSGEGLAAASDALLARFARLVRADAPGGGGTPRLPGPGTGRPTCGPLRPSGSGTAAREAFLTGATAGAMKEPGRPGRPRLRLPSGEAEALAAYDPERRTAKGRDPNTDQARRPCGACSVVDDGQPCGWKDRGGPARGGDWRPWRVAGTRPGAQGLVGLCGVSSGKAGQAQTPARPRRPAPRSSIRVDSSRLDKL
jgi:hypothetical protein